MEAALISCTLTNMESFRVFILQIHTDGVSVIGLYLLCRFSFRISFLTALVFKAKTAPACLCACVGVWQVCQGHGNGWQLQLSHRKETRVRSCARHFESKLSKFSSSPPPDFTCSVHKLFTVQVLYGYLSVNPCKTNRKKKVLVLQHNNAATGDFGCLPTFSRACFEAGLVIKG